MHKCLRNKQCVVDDAQEIDIVMTMYDLMEYSDNY